MEWKNIGEVCKDKFWIMPATPKFINEKIIPYITGKNIKNGMLSFENIKYISKEDYLKLIKNRKILKNDILISMIGTIGEIGIVKENIEFYGQNLYLLRLNREIILNEYFFYYFIQDRVKNKLISKRKASTQGYIRAEQLENLKIPVKIVKKLELAQSFINKKKEQIKLCDDLIQSTFYDMFGDPIKNEKKWEIKKLNETTNIITGNTPSRKEIKNYGNFIEWIKSDNINTPSTFLTTASEFLSEIGLEKGRFVEANSILMTCIAGSLSCIGNVAITDRKVAFNQQINAIIPLKYNTRFLYVLFLLTKKYIQNSANNSMKGMI